MEQKRGGVPKRKPLEVQQDLSLTMQLYLKGVGPTAIAVEVCKSRKYTLSHSQIIQDIAKCLKVWEDERTEMIDKQKTIELAKLNQLEATYWTAWEASKTARVKSVVRKSGPTAAPNFVATEDHTTNSIGDDRWLQGIERCIAQRCKIMGFDNVVVPEGSKPQDVARRIVFNTRKQPPEYTEAIEVDEQPVAGKKQKALPQKITK